MFNYFFAVVGTAVVPMMTTSGIKSLQCNTTATSLKDCTIRQGICTESVVAEIACGSSVITGEL